MSIVGFHHFCASYPCKGTISLVVISFVYYRDLSCYTLFKDGRFFGVSNMKVKERDKKPNCGEFWGKCDKKRRSTYIQIAVVNLLMVIIFLVSVCQHLKSLKEETESVVDKKYLGYSGKASTVCKVHKNYNCAITCTDFDFNNDENMDNLYGSLEGAKKDYETCSLFLERAQFKNSVLEENWIQIDPDKHPKITELGINGGNLAGVKEKAFASLPDLITLTISSTNITSLRRDSFLHLSELKILQFHGNAQLSSVENGFLQNFELDTIMVQDIPVPGPMATNFFANLTGDVPTKTIKTLDWSYNNFGYFPKKLLNNIPYIQILTLRGSNITEFEEGSFDEISRTQNVFLDFNNLERLPEKTFRPVVEYVGGLYVDHNKLICDCDMEWLQLFVIEVKNYTFGDFQNVLCYGPEENKNVPFLEAVMCPTTETTTSVTYGSSTTPTEIPTATDESTSDTEETPTSTDPTTPPEVVVDCEPKTKYSRFRRSLSTLLPVKFRITPRSEITIRLPPKTLDFTIEEEDGIVNINLNQTDKANNYYVLYWKGTPSSHRVQQPDVRCLSSIKPTRFELQVDDIELDHETDYVFCIFNSPDDEINILNCDAYKTQPSYENRAWLTNKSIPITTYLLIVGAALFLITGGSTFYLLVRKNPSLIRGSKRVIVVKRHNKAQIMVLPSGYTNNPEITSTAKYALTDSSVRNSMASSVSGDSMSTVSYVSGIQPTPIEIFTYRLERLQALTMGNRGQDDEDSCGTPPPLPPYPMTFTRHQGRLPPNVDLLFEYEWYTTTTMTTTS